MRFGFFNAEHAKNAEEETNTLSGSLRSLRSLRLSVFTIIS